VKHINVKNLSV